MGKIKTSKALYLLIAVLVIFAIVITAMFYQQMLMLMNILNRPPTTQPPPSNQYSASLPMRFTVSDMWAGGATGSATVTVYKYATLEQFDTGTTDNNGIWTTNKAVKTGERYWVKVVKKNADNKEAVYFYDITVPYATTTGQVYHYCTLDFYTLGRYAISVQMPNGTSLTDGATYNVTEAGAIYPTFTIMIRNTASSDSGVRDYFDPIKSGGVQRQTTFIFQTSQTGYEKLLVQNYQILYQTSSARYYGFKVDPMKLVLDKKPDGTYNTYQGEDLDGIYTFSIQFDCSALTSSDLVSVNLYLYTHDNIDNFRNYGTHLSDAVALDTSFDWKLTA